MEQFSFDRMTHIDRFKLTVKRMKTGQNKNRRFHDHDFSEIAIVTESEGTLHWCGGKSFPLVPGDVLLLHPGVSHGYAGTEHFAVVNLLYDADALPLPQLDGGNLKLFSRFTDNRFRAEAPEKPLLRLAPPELARINERIARMEEEIRSARPGNRLCVFGLFLTILVELARVGGPAGQEHFAASAAPALQYLNLHYREAVDVDLLAKLCRMSRSGFFTAFRKLTGCTPVAYQHEKRLGLALAMLQTGHHTLGEIADACGFCDSNYLSKLFTRKFGVSPGRMRRRCDSRSETPSGRA